MHESISKIIPIMSFSKNEFEPTIKRITRSFLRIVILITAKIEALFVNKMQNVRKLSDLNIKRNSGNVLFANTPPS
jgi:hypothetical protein